MTNRAGLQGRNRYRTLFIVLNGQLACQVKIRENLTIDLPATGPLGPKWPVAPEIVRKSTENASAMEHWRVTPVTTGKAAGFRRIGSCYSLVWRYTTGW
jgi:hypothetical protein